MKNFVAYQIALQAARRVGDCLVSIRKQDRDLDRQVRRATQSFVLNLAEGSRRRGQDRVHLFRIAAGSAAEVLAALDIAVAWGYIGEPTAEPSRQLLDRLLGICWRLTEGSKPMSTARQAKG